MKKAYVKPEITVEMLVMDAPIAMNCVTDFEDMDALIQFGYFSDNNDRGVNCAQIYEDGHDGICYHSNVQEAFLS